MKVAAFVLGTCLLAESSSCDESQPARSDSGVVKASTRIEVGPDGLTVEQRNVQERIKRDNLPGSIKHLYVISPYSGQVLIYSTVRGKVTSSGKRLTPKTANWSSTSWSGSDSHPGPSGSGMEVKIGDAYARTSEVLQDDGTYGDSVEYVYWFDAKGVYHQHYLGDEILHVSDQPLAVKSVVLNMELVGDEKDAAK